MPWQQQLLLFEVLANTGTATTARQATANIAACTKRSRRLIISLLNWLAIPFASGNGPLLPWTCRTSLGSRRLIKLLSMRRNFN
jgi:hypothetical protein